MKFEFDNNIPIYLQLVENLKNYIISGRLKPGERLPSVRDLALSLKVNPNTLQKALAELEDLKLVYTERTNGKYITTDEKLIEKLKIEYASLLTKNYLINMQNLGYTQNDLRKFIKESEW